jgi:hypothetical protein
VNVAALLLALSLTAPGVADGQGAEVRLAVVAGNNRGLDNEQRLDFAEQDARRVYAVFTQLAGVEPANAALVLGGGPEELVRAVGVMVGQARALSGAGPVTLLLYVSAHADEEALHLGGQRLELARLRELLDHAPARLRVTVIDGCRLPVKAVGKGGRPGPEVPVVIDRSTRVDGDVFIAAASAGELAQEWTELQGSLFTHHLLAGLRGAADFDRNGRVTLAEAYAHAYRATLARAAEAGLVPQRPSFDLRIAGFGDWVFTRVGTGGAQITLADELGGRFWVTDQRSDVLAEVEKRPGEPVSLSFAPGRYRVIRLGAEWSEAADVNLAFGGARRLAASDLVRVRAERALAKGGPSLELRPWAVVFGLDAASPRGTGMSAPLGGELGVERAMGAWRVRLSLGAGWSSTTAERARLTQVELRLPAAASWGFPVSQATLGLGVELRPRLVWQEAWRTVDAGGLAGAIPSQRALLLAVGPQLSASLPLGDRLALGLEAWGGWEWGPDQRGQVGVRSLAQLRLLAGWKL